MKERLHIKLFLGGVSYGRVGSRNLRKYMNTKYVSDITFRTFQAHAGRILEMQLMQERGHNVFITNSVDKTIRVWDVDDVLEVVHPLDRLLTSIDDLQR